MTGTPDFQLAITAGTGKSFVPYLRRQLVAAHRYLSPAVRELSLALVGDARMAALHRRFMGLPGPTDVLTFPLDLDARGRPTSGEVIVCVPEARRRAAETRTPPRDEVLLYAVHGLLHLCGFDDTTPRAFRAMHRKEDEILTRLGIGPVFAPQPRLPSVRRRSTMR